VAGLAVRLYLGGAVAPRRYFTWGQAARRAVLAVLLMHAVVGLDVLVRMVWSSRLFGLPAPPAILMTASTSGLWPTVYYVVNFAWVVIFVALVLGYYRTARVLAVPVIVPGLSLANYLHDPHLIGVGVTELIILVTAAALITPDAARAQAAAPAPPRYPRATTA
jgi:hypothetical protein